MCLPGSGGGILQPNGDPRPRPGGDRKRPAGNKIIIDRSGHGFRQAHRQGSLRPKMLLSIRITTDRMSQGSEHSGGFRMARKPSRSRSKAADGPRQKRSPTHPKREQGPVSVLVVRRGSVRRFARLKKRTDELPLEVVWDRRQADRRRQQTVRAKTELRRSERRQEPPFSWGAADFLVVLESTQRGDVAVSVEPSQPPTTPAPPTTLSM